MSNKLFDITPISRAIWEDRYGLKNDKGELVEKDIFENFDRVATAIASNEEDPEKWTKAFSELFYAKEFCPAGRILANAGTHFSQLLNCYVIPFKDDSLDSIMDTAHKMAVTQKYGGGCIGPESLVITDIGPIPLKDIVNDNKGSEVLSYNPETQETEFCKILDRHTTDVSGDRVFKVEFDNLRGGVAASMRASDWHPFFVFDGEKTVEVRADELKEGMVVIGSTALKTKLETWPWLLGYVAGDGAIDCNGGSRQNANRIRIVDMYEGCINRASEIMGVSPHLSSDTRYQVDVWACEAYGDVAEKIKEEFGGYQTSYTKHVPNSVWSMSPESRLSFLVGYLDADGCFNKDKKRFEVSTVSETLSDEILSLAGSLGIRANKRFRRPRREKESCLWEVRLSGSQYITDCVTQISAKYKDNNVGPVNGPVTLSNVWKDKLAEVGVNARTDKARRGKTEIDGNNVSLSYWLQYGKATRETAAVILRSCGEDLLANAILSSQIVKSSKPTGVRETLYDLTVEKNQTYLASDPSTGAFVVVHNTGFNYSNLRPEGSFIKGVNGRSCGMIGFIDMMSVVSGVIEQGGSRRGANLGILEVWHPDSWKYISYKNDHEWDSLRDVITVQDEEKWEYFKKDVPYKLQMYNISIGVTDDFMEALRNGDVWRFHWKDEEWILHTIVYKEWQFKTETYKEKIIEVMANSAETALWKARKIIPYVKTKDQFEVKGTRQIMASEVWDKICYNAWANGCPGLINISEARRMHNGEYCSPLLGANPCGEQMLPAYGCCDLGALVLSTFFDKETGQVNYDKLKEATWRGVRFLDDVLDICDFPYPEMKKLSQSERRIGLGTMGIHDLLIALKVGYDTEEGRKLTSDVLSFIRDEAYRASIELAKEKGSFPLFDADKYLESPFIKTLPQDIQDDIRKYGIRNICLLTQAPTGTIGTMYSVSQGCEPWYDLVLTRNTGFGVFEDGSQDYLKWRDSVPEGTPKPSYFKGATEISPADHVKMLCLFSKHVDAAVSKTVNLQNSATVKDVDQIFRLAMDNHAKGITIFRDGCRRGVLSSAMKKAPEEEIISPSFSVDDEESYFKKRGNRTAGATTRIHLQGHNMYVTVNKNKKTDLVEVFATVGESKSPKTSQTSGVEDSWAEGLGKMISLALRAGVQPESIIRNLKNIPSDKPVFCTIGDCEVSEPIPSPPHAIARVMEEELKYSSLTAEKAPEELPTGGVCDNCGSNRIKWKTSTCYDCKDCAHTGCGG